MILFNNDHCIIFEMKLEAMWEKLKIRYIRSQTDEWSAVVLNNERSDGLNPDAILAATIDRRAILATVELSARLGSEMKKYIARRGAETSGWTKRPIFLFFLSSLVAQNKKQFTRALYIFFWFQFSCARRFWFNKTNSAVIIQTSKYLKYL